jgi:hypothetical protein
MTPRSLGSRRFRPKARTQEEDRTPLHEQELAAMKAWGELERFYETGDRVEASRWHNAGKRLYVHLLDRIARPTDLNPQAVISYLRLHGWEAQAQAIEAAERMQAKEPLTGGTQ